MLKGWPVITFWIEFGEQLNFSKKKENEICYMKSEEDQNEHIQSFLARALAGRTIDLLNIHAITLH